MIALKDIKTFDGAIAAATFMHWDEKQYVIIVRPRLDSTEIQQIEIAQLEKYNGDWVASLSLAELVAMTSSVKVLSIPQAISLHIKPKFNKFLLQFPKKGTTEGPIMDQWVEALAKFAESYEKSTGQFK